MAETTNVDRAHANDDKASIERFSQNSLEGWIDTPYVKVLFSEYYAQASRICAVDLGDQLMNYDNKIRTLFSALEMKVLNLHRISSQENTKQNTRGLRRELNAIDNFRTSIMEAIEEKRSAIGNWRLKTLALIEAYNNRIAIYIDDVLASKTVVVDYPKLDETDLPSIFTDELALAAKQLEQYEARIDRLMNNHSNQSAGQQQ